MKEKQRRPYQRPEPALNPARLHKEWVDLEDGDVCVWEMTAAQMLQMSERAARPAIDPRGGVSGSAAAAWMVAFSVHHGDEPASPRVWDDLQVDAIYALRFEEFARLQDAIQRLNGLKPQQVEALRDFTAATGAPKASGSSGSASKSCTASRAKSTSPTTS